MGYKVVVSEHADKDIDGIIRYIATKLKNQIAARTFIEDLNKHYKLLAEYPLTFPVSRYPLLARSGYRCLRINNYIVLYSINEEKQEVLIARVVYSRRDLTKIV
jgi:plasmid stabilization system protein ParE